MEIVVVLFIISLLVSFAIPTYKRHILKIRADEAKATILAISFAQERYKQEIGEYYPDSGEVLNENVIAKNLKVDLTNSNNFIYSLYRVDDSYLIRAFIRGDEAKCIDESSVKCKQRNTINSDSWINNYQNSNRYLEFKYPDKFATSEYVEFGINYENLY